MKSRCSLSLHCLVKGTQKCEHAKQCKFLGAHWIYEVHKLYFIRLRREVYILFQYFDEVLRIIVMDMRRNYKVNCVIIIVVSIIIIIAIAITTVTIAGIPNFEVKANGYSVCI